MSMIGENIKKLRAEQGITQKQLADSVNVSFQAVSKWENGEGVPDTMLLPLIAEVFGVAIDELFRASTKRCANRAQRLLAVYERTGRLEDFLRADFEFQKQLEKNPEPELYRSCGVMYQYLADNSVKKAFELFDLVLEKKAQDETYFRTLKQKMILMAKIGKSGECVANMKELAGESGRSSKNAAGAGNDKNTDWCECMMFAYYLDGQYTQARQEFLAAKEKGMESYGLYCLAGDTYRKTKEYEEAFACWEHARKLEDKFSDALWSEAFCCQELNDKAKEKEAWERILAWQSKEGLEEENIFVRKMIAACEREAEKEKSM